jgi:HSP20 family protein
MEWKKLAPWNWFGKEQEHLPVRRGSTAQDFFGALRDEMDRMFEQSLQRIGLPAEGGLVLKPSLDISEGKRAYTVRVEIPGVDKGDVTLNVQDDTLTIRGEKRREREESDESYHCVERSYGAFQRVLTLPDDADPERIDAKFRRGILKITIPKSEARTAPSRSIPIEHD